MDTGNIAVIGGTGFEELPAEIFTESIDVETDYGIARVLSISDNYTEPRKLYFLSRHGANHGLAPHQINYAANILALKELGVRWAFATNAVGSLRTDLPVGSLVVLDDFIDFTRHRPATLFTGDEWRHTDFTAPYSLILRNSLVRAAEHLEVPVIESGTYVCCDGPRFESPAEIRLFHNWGGDVVGMTGIPEVIFAREADVEYAGLAVVTNLGAGLSDTFVAHEEITQIMIGALPRVREIIMTAARILVEQAF